MAKTLTKEQLISSLTQPHEGCEDADQSLYDAVDLDEWELDRLLQLREITKKKRKKRAKPATDGDTTPATRKTFSKGFAYVKIPLDLSELEIKAFRTVGVKNPEQVSDHLQSLFTTTRPEGPGGSSFIEKGERTEGCVSFNVNALIKLMLAGVEDAAKYREHVLQLSEAHRNLLSVQLMDPSTFTDAKIRSMLIEASTKAGNDDATTARLIAEVITN